MEVDVTIFEMGPRDGLQNESNFINTPDKIKLVNLLSTSGIRKIETASFVSSRWVPQMADGEEVMAGIQRKSDVAFTALTPNEKGLERAIKAKADEIAVFGSASEGFSKANINKSIMESLQTFRPIVKAIGKSCFSREIISLHRTKGWTNYEETRQLFLNNVLSEDENYYNSNILGRYMKKDFHHEQCPTNS